MNQDGPEIHFFEPTADAIRDSGSCPAWVEATILLGYCYSEKCFAEEKKRHRQVTIISAPCKSIAAPLIALGSFRQGLEQKNKSSPEEYYERLLSEIEQAVKITDSVILLDRHNRQWRFSDAGASGIRVADAKYRETICKKGRVIKNPNGRCSALIQRQNAEGWRLKGHPPAVGKKLEAAIYKNLPISAGAICIDNLERSWDKILLVGEAEGDRTEYVQRLQGTGFSYGSVQQTLYELLTLDASTSQVRRLAFCTYRQPELVNNKPALVIADGCRSLLAALECFGESDIIGVASRDDSASNIDSVAIKLNELKRFYRDSEGQKLAANLPRSLNIKSMERINEY